MEEKIINWDVFNRKLRRFLIEGFAKKDGKPREYATPAELKEKVNDRLRNFLLNGEVKEGVTLPQPAAPYVLSKKSNTAPKLSEISTKANEKPQVEKERLTREEMAEEFKYKLAQTRETLSKKLSWKSTPGAIYRRREKAAEAVKPLRNAAAIVGITCLGGQYGFWSTPLLNGLREAAPEMWANFGDLAYLVSDFAVIGVGVGALGYAVSAGVKSLKAKVQVEKQECMHQVYYERGDADDVERLMERKGISREEAMARLEVEPAEKITLASRITKPIHTRALIKARKKYSSYPLHRLQQISHEKRQEERRAIKPEVTPAMKSAKKAGLTALGLGGIMVGNAILSGFSPAEMMEPSLAFASTCKTMITGACLGGVATIALYEGAKACRDYSNKEENPFVTLGEKTISACGIAKTKLGDFANKVSEKIRPSDVKEVIRAEFSEAGSENSVAPTNTNNTYEMNR